jgi:putative transposase
LPGAGQHRRELKFELVATAHSSADAFPVTRVCQALGLSRATSYRWQAAEPRPDRDMEPHAPGREIALEMPAYGSRRVTHELRRRGVAVHHKRVLRLRREDNLLCLRKRALVRTTDAAPPFAGHPNLLPELTVTGLDHLWVADIMSSRLPQEFVYLAVLLEADSRRCLGGGLECYLGAALALAALQMALTTRPVRPGLVHHSARGVQYALQAYTNLVQTQGIRISMRRTGDP